MNVRLEAKEIERVLAEGSRRVMNAIVGGMGEGKFFMAGDYGGVLGHVLGAAAELVASKLVGEEWDPVRMDFDTRRDVGGYDVRLTMRRGGEFRICQPHEDPGKRYLAIGLGPRPWTFRAVGTIDGEGARAVGTLEDRMGYGEAWWVREDLLAPIPEEMARRVREPDAQEIIARAAMSLKRRR